MATQSILFLFLFPLCLRCKFVPGRIYPSGFDLKEKILQGRHTQSQAVNLCQDHLHCAGFTYQGLIDNTMLPSRRYNIYFVRHISAKFFDATSPGWVTFSTEREFLLYQGSFPEEDDPNAEGDAGQCTGSKLALTEARANCLEAEECAAFEYDLQEGTSHGWHRSLKLDMRRFVPTSAGRRSMMTFVKPSSSRITGNHDDVAGVSCCPHHPFNLSHAFKTAKEADAVTRLPCDNSFYAFRYDHLEPAAPAVLTGCAAGWAADRWSWQSILLSPSETGAARSWEAEVLFLRNTSMAKEITGDERDHGWPRSYKKTLTGQTLLKIIRENRENSMIQIPQLNTWEMNETDMWAPLHTWWSWPEAIPIDLLVLVTENLAKMAKMNHFVSLGQAGTGFRYFPRILDRWSTVFHGYRHWVIFPRGVDIKKYLICPCSEKERGEKATIIKKRKTLEDLLNTGNFLDVQDWFTNILPRLREKTWFGQKIIEVFQAPGETLYVPTGMAYLVLNLEDNLSVTKLFLSTGALAELASLHHVGEQTSTTRVVHNLLNGVLEAEDRRFLRNMLEEMADRKQEEGAKEKPYGGCGQ